MKNYTSPVYLKAETGNNFSDILGLSLEFNIIPEDNSVVITQDAENIFG